ncbi:uncharacterized protein EV420DRAFT_222429 [Desarmillaria tabescens]|uniref:Uncharacterized protein n=1 Tax=Armillaria tabescens TaxID=1929756 RepID=A0AA39N7V9_ARMTA|nr:uncharacterized protein EV420DRAFT_222429 [Desarmillaria tabescens]KAK0460660.1 hypothetical protein EV420DRAFT_222429 [Desarmillaria tabescens]
MPRNHSRVLPFLRPRPQLHPDAKNPTSMPPEICTAQDVAHRPISCRPDSILLPRLIEFLVGLVNSLDIAGVSCRDASESMEMMSFRGEEDVSEYAYEVFSAIHSIVRAIAGPIGAVRQHVEETTTLQLPTNGVPIQVCSANDKAYYIWLYAE